MMKIAAVTDDDRTISPHFGRAIYYAVLTVENGQIVARELRDKASHHDFQREGLHGHHEHHDDSRGRGFGRHSAEKHQRMFAAITDCEVVLARGMGRGAHNGLQQIGVKPILTDINDIETATQAVIDDSIEDHPERLH
jgi:predicted Fe-Mo cluster-binding NifX family protein